MKHRCGGVMIRVKFLQWEVFLLESTKNSDVYQKIIVEICKTICKKKRKSTKWGNGFWKTMPTWTRPVNQNYKEGSPGWRKSPDLYPFEMLWNDLELVVQPFKHLTYERKEWCILSSDHLQRIDGSMKCLTVVGKCHDLWGFVFVCQFCVPSMVSFDLNCYGM